jgi:hypothetical protein
MKINISVLILSLLTGCNSTISTYNPNELDNDELSVITVEDLGVWIGYDEIHASIIAVRDASGNKVITVNPWVSIPDEILLPQGDYQIGVGCLTRHKTTYHSVNMHLEKGSKYKAFCVGKYESGLLGGNFTEIHGFISKDDDFDADKIKKQAVINSNSQH